MFRLTATLCLAASLCACSPSTEGRHPSEGRPSGEGGAPPRPVRQSLDGYAEALEREYGFSGAILVARGDSLLLSEGYGLANDLRDIPAAPTTRFPIASVTKPFTATALLVLEQRGRVQLEDPICDYLPRCPATWGSITIRHLLDQTAGIRQLSAQAIEGKQLSEVVEDLKDEPLLFPVGEDYTYSNSNYYMAGAVIERASGMSWQDFLTAAVFEPAGMTQTVSDSAAEPADDSVVGYATSLAPSAERLPVTERISEIAGHGTPRPDPAGGLLSTVGDLHAFARALNHGQLLARASLRQMWTPQGPARYADYGLGWERFRQHGTYVVQHGGAIPGFSSCLSLYPTEDVYVAVLSNVVESVACEYIGRDLGAIALGRPHRLPDAPSPVEVPSRTLNRYVGRYRAGAFGGGEILEIRTQRGRLVLMRPGVFPPPLNQLTILRPWSERAFFNPHDPYVRISFERTPKRDTSTMIFHLPAYKRFPPMLERYERIG